MDASAALERLRDISSQVRVAVVFDSSGAVLGSTLGDDERSQQLATEARALSDAAEARGAEGQFAQLEVALQGGSSSSATASGWSRRRRRRSRRSGSSSTT
jgi:hypothetical protein